MTQGDWFDELPSQVSAKRRRTQARLLALQALCVFEAVGEEFGPRLESFLHDPVIHQDLALESPVAPDLIGLARARTLRAWRDREQLDELISRTATQWRIGRMPPVDRNVLRLGVYELLKEPTTPVNVVINEAVELAKLFGDDDSSAFVNGVLDAIRRELQAPVAESESAGDQTT